MSRDLWQTKRIVRPVDKIRKLITLPTTSQTTFRRRACLEYNSADANDNFSIFTEAITNAFTFECWVKPLSTSANKQTILRFGELTPEFEFSLLNNTLTATIWKSSNSFNTTATGLVLEFNWSHIAATYDNVTFKLYVNGQLISSRAVAGPADLAQLFFHVAQEGPLVNLYIGRIAEIRVWNIARTSDQILSTYQNPRVANLDDVTGLIHYFKCNGVFVDGTGNEKCQIDTNRTIGSSHGKFTTDDWPPLIYGASFSCIEWNVTLDRSVSIQFPISRPSNCTGMLVVRWLDSSGNVQRRRFWDLSGVDIQPLPAMYEGEPLANGFTFELYNVDGADTTALGSDLIISISDTTTPTTSYDHTQQIAATPVVGTALGVPFPLTFPMQFNTPQSYT